MSREMRLIAQAGKTFYFATLWLNTSVRRDAALAYNFCRNVDDIADGVISEPQRNTRLREIAIAVRAGDVSQQLVRPLAPLLAHYPEIRDPLALLVDACRNDDPSLIINDEFDLESYAFGVAGNVGLVMYPILGGTVDSGRSHAADLGIAMQYTNIARDVLEDLSRNRVYLPSTWLEGCDMRKLLHRTLETEEVVVNAVKRILRLADEKYARGLAGIRYLAPENRFAIKVAARCYAAIGERVLHDGQLARQRATVSFARKVALAVSVGLCPIQKLARRAPVYRT